MTTSHSIRILAAAIAAAFMAGCNNDGNNPGSPAAAAPAATVQFSAFTQQIFATPANSPPVTVNGVNLNFDVNDDKTAFSALLM